MGRESDHEICRARRCLRWGVTYRGTGEVPCAVAAVVETLAELGLEVRTEEVRGGAVLVQAEDRRSLYRRLAASVPNRVTGWIETEASGDGSDDEIRLCLDLTVAPDYRAVVGVLWSCWFLGLIYLSWAAESWRGSGESIVLVAGLGGALLLIGCGAWLLRVLGGGRMTEALWKPVLQRLEDSGAVVEPEGTGVGRRYVAWFGGYGLSLLLYVVWLVATTNLEGAGPSLDLVQGFLLCLVGVVVVLLVTAAAMAFWPGFALRAGAALLGLPGPLFMIYLLAMPLPVLLILVSGIDVERLAEDQIRVLSRSLLGFSGLIGAAAVALAASFIWGASPFRSHLQRTHSRRGSRGIYGTAVRGGRSLVILRSLLLVAALGLAAIVLAGLALALCWSVQAVAPVWDAPLLRIPQVSEFLLAAAFGFSLDPSATSFVSGLAWILWSGTVWTLLAISVGQLAMERRRLRHRLSKAPARPSEPDRTAVDRMERLLGRLEAGRPPVRLSISPRPAVYACSHQFFWPRREWIVEVSRGALMALSGPEVDALLAHELAHLSRGHVFRHDLARWLGRIAFVGDGFSRSLLDSFGWELQADEDAVLIWGVSGESMIRCVQKVSSARSHTWIAPAGLAVDVQPPSPGMDRENPPEGAGKGGGTDWAGGWRYFRDQYRGIVALHYWHPVPAERVERIRHLGREAVVRRGRS